MLNRAAISFYNLAAMKRLATSKGHVLSLERQMLHRGSSPLLSAGDHTEDPSTMPGWDTFYHLISRLVAAKVQSQVSKSTACFHP
jgi:hypothetical protein